MNTRGKPECDLSLPSPIEMLETGSAPSQEAKPNIKVIQMTDDTFAEMMNRMNLVTLSTFSQVNKRIHEAAKKAPVPIVMSTGETMDKPFSEVRKVLDDYQKKEKHHQQTLLDKERCYCPSGGKTALQIAGAAGIAACVGGEAGVVFATAGTQAFTTAITAGIPTILAGVIYTFFGMKLFEACQNDTKQSIDHLKANPVPEPKVSR